MAYVRKKIVNGQEYYYLVKGVREGSKVRQKVVKYLGKKKLTKEELKKIISSLNNR